MIITISATLTPDQIDILAKQKGYQDTISVPWEEQAIVQVSNPQSKEDFIRQVYEGIILSDATREFISYTTRQKEEARIAEENAIRESVANSITSTVWEQ